MRKLSVAIPATGAGAGRCRLWLAGGPVVHDHHDDGQSRDRSRGLLGGPSQCAVRWVDRRHLERPPHAAARDSRVTSAFMVVIDPGERRGTWRTSSTCAGTLRLKDISYGYHHYYRVAGAHPGCAAPGIDCLKRSGARMVDVFVPNAGGRDIDGTFRRVR